MQPLKILIADDSKLMCERLSVGLQEIGGISVIGQAQDGQDAIKFIENDLPDVVILDIQMPKTSGIEVLKRIQQQNRRPVVMMFTNYPYQQYRTTCAKAGADYFFDKSKEFDKLMRTVRRISRGAA